MRHKNITGECQDPMLVPTALEGHTCRKVVYLWQLATATPLGRTKRGANMIGLAKKSPPSCTANYLRYKCGNDVVAFKI